MLDKVFHVLAKSLSAVCFQIFFMFFVFFLFFENLKDHLSDRNGSPFFILFYFCKKEKEEKTR